MSELKKIRLYREDNGEYSTSEARQDDLSGCYYQSIDVDSVIESQAAEIKRLNERVGELDKKYGDIMEYSVQMTRKYELAEKELEDLKA